MSNVFWNSLDHSTTKSRGGVYVNDQKGFDAFKGMVERMRATLEEKKKNTSFTRWIDNDLKKLAKLKKEGEELFKKRTVFTFWENLELEVEKNIIQKQEGVVNG